MSMTGKDDPSLREYHARQRANQAVNEANAVRESVRGSRRAPGDVEEALEKAIALLDEGSVEEARDELARALRKLKKIRP